MNKPAIYPFVSNEHFLSVLVVLADKDSSVTVYRRYNNDTEIVRGSQGVKMKNPEQLFIDYEVPQGVPIEYWVVAESGKEKIESEHKVTQPYNFGRDVLFDLADPRRGMLVWVENFNQYKYGISRDVQRVWGRADPVVISGVREMFQGQLNLLTLDLDERKNLLDIVKNGSTVAFSAQYPEYGLDGVLYFAVGDVVEQRTTSKARESSRRYSFDIQQVTPPPAVYRYPEYGRTWREFRENTWRVEASHQWWEAVAQ